LTEGAPPRIGVVGLAGSWSTEALADAVCERTGTRLVVEMDRVVLDSSSLRLDFEGANLAALDALVVKKLGQRYGPEMHERLELLRCAEAAGVRVFSRPDRIAAMVDRMSCTLGLLRAGIPIPPTVITEDPKQAAEAVRRFGRAILKPLYSTKAEGMVLVDADKDDVEAAVAQHRHPGQRVYYVQQQVELLDGRDLGCAFLGGEYVGTYARVGSGGSWNTTIRDGGFYSAFEPDAEIVALARRAQAPFRLDFTSVDVALTPSGPLVFEVSAFGGFRGLRDGLGIDAAALFADYVVRALAGRTP
jgi:ribosomal protein S6--L-glutamate ligase